MVQLYSGRPPSWPTTLGITVDIMLMSIAATKIDTSTAMVGASFSRGILIVLYCSVTRGRRWVVEPQHISLHESRGTTPRWRGIAVCWQSPTHSNSPLLFLLLGADQGVGMALAQAGVGDADELRALAELGQAARAEVAHARAQPANQLEHHVAHRAAVGDDGLHALRHPRIELLLVDAEGEAAEAIDGRALRGHAAVDLDAGAVAQDRRARALVGAGQEAADHHTGRPRRERLGHVARHPHAAVGHDRHAVRRGGPHAVHHRRELGHADARDHARGAG